MIPYEHQTALLSSQGLLLMLFVVAAKNADGQAVREVRVYNVSDYKAAVHRQCCHPAHPPLLHSR